MTQLRAIAIAAFFLGIGFAGEPFVPMRALIAAVILLVASLIFQRLTTPLVSFIIAFAGLILTCYLQHSEFYPGEFVVALGFGLLAAASLGWRSAPATVSIVGVAIGTTLFFLR